LYDQLLSLNSSPIVALNRAVALARVRGPHEALAAIEPLSRDPKLRQYHLLLALRGQLLLELGRSSEAAAAFKRALACACTEPERRLLMRRLEACAG
jgi:RNA polymerase sigma-70 factor (ECF subfamily)